MTLFVHTERYWPRNLSVQCFVSMLLCELSVFEKCWLSMCNTAIFSGSWKLPLSSLLNYFCFELEENSLFWLFPFLHICFPWVISFQPHKFELFLHSATVSLKFASDLLLIHFDIIPFALVHPEKICYFTVHLQDLVRLIKLARNHCAIL